MSAFSHALDLYTTFYNELSYIENEIIRDNRAKRYATITAQQLMIYEKSFWNDVIIEIEKLKPSDIKKALHNNVRAFL